MVLGFFKKPEKMPERMAVRPDGVRVQPNHKESAPAAHVSSDSKKNAQTAEFDSEETFYAGGSYGIEIEEESDVYAEMAEHAAISYASGQSDAARATLYSITKDNNDPAALRLWAMLFDLLRLTGDHDAFNAACLDFARTCELSPPSWNANLEEAADGALQEAADEVVFQGAVVGDSSVFDDLLQAMSQGKTRRLNFGRMAGLDNEAAAKLAKLLHQVRRRGLTWDLLGAEGLSARLVKRIRAGQRQNEPVWLLLLELFLFLGKEAEFEERALDYAITFEVSPPNWERPKISPSRTEAAKPAKPTPVLRGELLEGKIDSAKPLLKSGKECKLDFSQVTRMDLPSAAALLQAIRSSGCAAIFFHPNRMVAEILNVAGVAGIARVELSRQ